MTEFYGSVFSLYVKNYQTVPNVAALFCILNSSTGEFQSLRIFTNVGIVSLSNSSHFT